MSGKVFDPQLKKWNSKDLQKLDKLINSTDFSILLRYFKEILEKQQNTLITIQRAPSEDGTAFLQRLSLLQGRHQILDDLVKIRERVKNTKEYLDRNQKTK